jgi:carboxynorspermidine decarboxylase
MNNLVSPSQHTDGLVAASFAGVHPRDVLETPFAFYNHYQMRTAVEILRRNAGSTKILYSTKACAFARLLTDLGDAVDGFSVSSPYELRVAASLSSLPRYVHLTSPGLVAEWLTSSFLPSHVSFNSFGQYNRCKAAAEMGISCGFRLNPEISRTRDDRYNSCRRHSKLGVRISELIRFFSKGDVDLINGLHIHNSCLSESWQPLLETISLIESRLGCVLSKFEWINLGGGYVWDDATDFGPLEESVDRLTSKYDLEVFIEPGAGIVNSAGYLVASVIDVFKSDGKTIAVLNTTVNHLPEVFEYQFEPDVAEHREHGKHKYLLVGCTCLAGDLFGEYAFDQPLAVGSRVTFENVGAYSLVKGHMFNGINLPSVYLLHQTGRLELIREFTFENFANQCGFPSNEYANF